MPQGQSPFDQIFAEALRSRQSGGGAPGKDPLESLAQWSRRALIVLAVVLVLALAACYWWFHPAINLGSRQVWTWIIAVAALAAGGLVPRGPVAAAVLAVAFVALLDLPRGSVGIGPVSVILPEGAYGTEWLSWLGLPGPAFSSGDYYPLLPYLMLYLAGVAMGSSWAERGYPGWARRLRVAPLNFVGRHALVVYVVHQPVLLPLCEALELAVG